MTVDLTRVEAQTLTTPQRSVARRRIAQTGITVLSVLTLVLLFVAAEASETTLCTEASPCTPAPLGFAALGALIACCFTAWISMWAAAAGATLFSFGLLLELAKTPDTEPLSYLTVAAFAVVATLLAWFGERTSTDEKVQTWQTRAVRQRPPTTQEQITQPSGVWRTMLLGTAAILIGLGLLWQYQGNERAARAEVVEATVVSHVDDFTVELRLPNERVVKTGVLAAASYPVGSTLRIRTDAEGLAQPLAEPYDATGWFAGAAMIGIPGLGAQLRRSRRARELRMLLHEPQPTTNVWYTPFQPAIYPADVQSGDRPIATIAKPARLLLSGTTAALPSETLLPRRAVLYGTPSIGSLCAVLPAGGSRLVVGRLERGAFGPEWTFASEEHPILDAPTEYHLASTELPEPDLPADHVPAVDLNAPPDRVRTHRFTSKRAYPGALVVPVIIGVPIMRGIDPATPQQLWLLSAGITAILSLLWWWVVVRPVLAWNGGGVAVAGVLRSIRLRWSEVDDFDHGFAGLSVVALNGRKATISDGGDTLFDTEPGYFPATRLRYAKRHAAPSVEPPRPPRRPGAVWVLPLAFVAATLLVAILNTN